MTHAVGFTAFTGILLLHLAGHGQSVKVTDLKKADISAFKTFGVAKGELTVPSDEQRISANVFHERMKTYVRRELEVKGYTYVEDSSADFTVDYVASAFDLYKNEDLGPLGGVPATDPSMMDQSRYWSKSYREGMLLLEVYRGDPKNLLWRAEGSADLVGGDGRILSAAIAKAFRKFPKQGSSSRKRRK